MTKFNKAGYAVGSILLLLAAFFSISLMLQPLDFGTYGPGRNNFFFSLGHILFSVYGFCSILIPVFLFTSAMVCIAGTWTIRRAMRLLTAVIPFFTAVITENICKSIAELDGNTFTGIKIGITVGLGTMLIIIEFLGVGIIADRLAEKTYQKNQNKSRKPEPADEEMPIDDEDDILPYIEQDIIPADIKPEKEQENTENQTSSSAAETLEPVENGNKEDNLNSGSVITEEEYQALTTDTPGEANSSPEIEELEWPEPLLQSDTKNDAFSDAKFIETFSDIQQKKTDDTVFKQNPEKINSEEIQDISEQENTVSGEDEEKETAPEIQDSDTTNEGSLDPDFFDIDMNETDDEEECDIALSHITPDTLTVLAEKTIPQPVTIPLTAANPNQPVSESSSTETQSIAIAEDVFAEMDKDIRRNLSINNKNTEQTPAVESIHNDIVQDNSVSETNTKAEYKIPEKTEAEITPDVPKVQPQIDISLVRIPAEKPVPEKKTFRIKGPYKIPTTLLTAYEDDQYWIIDEETKNASVQLKETLNEFNIEADVTGIKKGPVVTMFEILPAPGVKLSKIAALQDNIALRLAASSVRIVAPIPGKRAVGIEIPNKERSLVSFREIIEQDLPDYKKMAVPVILGKDILGKPQLLDLVKTPHLLIAGSTGSGKSVCVNSIILSILYKRSPEEVKLILIDPKIVELKLYNDIPHLLVPVITESKKAFQALQWALCEMERRYALLDGMGSRDISNYNRKIEEKHIATEKLPYIVIIIDEFADLMVTTGKELESTVARLAAMSRAVGIHLVLATQRPSIDVITGLIKANIPTRIAFMVASKMDSRIIIDQVGAEKLLGKGDMLYSSAVDPFPVRIQGTFVSDQEVENVVEYVKNFGEPEYIDEEVFVSDDDEGTDEPSLFSDGEDPLYGQALDIVVQAGKASASYIQRRLKIGYNRAARLVEEMEDRGIVGPANGSKPREIIHVP
ncbi:MAG: cell division protein FtsK [Treponema sp.]|nr:cell division protein FtsK [Treponema sp.]